MFTPDGKRVTYDETHNPVEALTRLQCVDSDNELHT